MVQIQDNLTLATDAHTSASIYTRECLINLVQLVHIKTHQYKLSKEDV